MINRVKIFSLKRIFTGNATLFTFFCLIQSLSTGLLSFFSAFVKRTETTFWNTYKAEQKYIFYKNNQDEEEVRSSTLKLQNFVVLSHVLKRWSSLDNSKIKRILLDKNKQLEKKRG